MNPYFNGEGVTLYQGDCREALKTLPDNSIDSIVTDPPAGIGFMGRDWDKDKGGRDSWIAWLADIASECKRVLKPGGHAFVWALPRTSHWTGMAWENAGFEPREKISHVFGSGFPKSHNISKAIDKKAGAKRDVVREGVKSGAHPDGNTYAKGLNAGFKDRELTAPATAAAAAWDGWGSALKPAYEEWWLFRKPVEGTLADNVLAHGTGGLNIDACRVEAGEENLGRHNNKPSMFNAKNTTPYVNNSGDKGRWPPNLLFSHDSRCEEGQPCVAECPCAMLDRQSGVKKSGVAVQRNRDGKVHNEVYGARKTLKTDDVGYGDTDGASRFFPCFYCPKPSKSEKNKGCENLAQKTPEEMTGRKAGSAGLVMKHDDGSDKANPYAGTTGQARGNHHPTCKPVKLMRWLCKLITPKDGVVLDPFCGSGTTGVAAKLEGFKFIGMDLDKDYLEIAKARIGAEEEALIKPVKQGESPSLFNGPEWN